MVILRALSVIKEGAWRYLIFFLAFVLMWLLLNRSGGVHVNNRWAVVISVIETLNLIATCNYNVVQSNQKLLNDKDYCSMMVLYAILTPR